MFPDEMPQNAVCRPESLGLGAGRTLLVPVEALSTKRNLREQPVRSLAPVVSQPQSSDL